MPKVMINDIVIADSDKTVLVEGNHYFPPESVKRELLTNSPTPYTCPWKGVCEYSNVVIEDQEFKDAAWRYPDVSEAAKSIEGYYAFDLQQATLQEG